MVPNLQSWSEHDKGSQRKVIDSGADNGSDSLKVSGSIMPLLDRESRTSRDEETCRRYSSARSILKNESPSEAQQTLAQPATTNSDETHFAKNTFSPILPASPTPESDLETSVPLALNEKTDTIASSVPMRRFPSTASQPQDPFTQVKRTPYVNGRVQNQMLPGSRTLSPSSKANLSPLTNANANDDTDFVSASIASVPETSTAETQGENGSFNTVEDQSIEKVVARLADETNSQEGTDSILDKTEELTVEVQQEKGKAEAAANRLDDSTLIMTESPRQSSGSNQLPLAAEANENAHAQTIPEKMPTPEEGHPDPLPRLPTFDSTDHETKRKVGDSSFMSPSVAKRQKRFKVPPTFTSTERPELPRDPSEGARQYRQDFLASRRSSESSTPTTSPRTKFTGFPGTTSENLRDPSERARKFRQEFLASRRSSETSTPTTSPRVQSTALTETIQDRRRNAETEKSVGQVTAHYQSADTEIESQKMTGGKELSPKSQTQVMEQDAAPLPNGNASKEPDGDDAKPGAQDRPSAYYGANSHMFVAHSADVEGPDAEQGTVLEAPSNHETRRAQSIEPNVPFQSPDRQEIEDNLPNAKGNANQTVDPEVGLVIASHAQSAIFHKDDQPMNPESDKVPQDLPVRADEICKQGSNAPTTETILDQVAEPGTAALESVHEQQSIEENADTQMPDEIAIEPTSKQRLIGVDTDTPMPDVQVDQQLTSLRPISHTGEPMNHITPLSFAVTEPNTEDQLHVSSTALESAIPQSSPISDPVMKAAEEHQNAIQPPVEKMEQNSPSVPQNIFDEFKATYPAYPGDVKHFAAICRKIGQLVKVNRMEHQSLWDDFIIRHKIDYPPYLRRCAEEAEDAVSYEGFYQTEIEGPQYQKRVINRRNLDEALTLVAVKSTIEQTLVEPVEQKSTSESDPVENMHHEYTPTSDDEPPKLVGSKIAPEAVTSREIVRKPSKSRVTIDLTEDDPPDEQPQKTKERSVSSQSSVPHLVNGVFVAPPPLQYRRDSSSSLYGVLYTPPAMQGSHVPPPPQSMRSPLVPAMGSTKSTAKSLRRSLPWIGSDHDVLRGSANVTASDSPKRLPGSELREVRTKGSSKSNDAPSQVSAVSSSNAARQSQGLLNTCHRVIQSNWGIKVFELLEPEYYHGQVLPESMIELLAEIASKVNVSEARGRIKEAIHTRIRDNARRGVDHSSQYRKMLKIDLEVVRDVVETSSMSTTSPFSLPHTNAAVAKQDEGTPSKWWDDDNSPFNSFARAYASIRHGSGNSFAKADSAELLNAKNAHQAPGGGVQLKKIDFLGWNL